MFDGWERFGPPRPQAEARSASFADILRGAINPVRNISKRKAAQGSRIASVAQPFAKMIEAERPVKVARRIPVKHLKIDPLPAALDPQ